MPAEFLSDAKRIRYQTIPFDLTTHDLHQFGFLSPTDRALIASQRREHNRLGFAVQLIVIRLMNHLPQEWYRQIPASLGVLLPKGPKISVPNEVYSCRSFSNLFKRTGNMWARGGLTGAPVRFLTDHEIRFIIRLTRQDYKHEISKGRRRYSSLICSLATSPIKHFT